VQWTRSASSTRGSTITVRQVWPYGAHGVGSGHLDGDERDLGQHHAVGHEVVEARRTKLEQSARRL
jgi:hypothetical protein